MNARVGDLAGRGALGQKLGKGKTRRAPKTADELRHMEKVAALPCMICGAWMVELHHEGTPRSNMRVLPLCAFHHRREFGPQAYHYNKRAFYALHGTSQELLDRVAKMIAADDDEALGRWF